MALTQRPRRSLPVICAFCALGALSAPAAAEGERAVSVGVGYATFSRPVEQMGNMEPTTVTPDGGGSLGVTYEHAIGSDFSLRGELAGGLFYGGHEDKQSALSYAVLGDAGITFRFDILKYVPYAFGGVGAVKTMGDAISSNTQLVLAVGGGLDILSSRERSWGFEGRLASFGGDVTIFTIGVRGTHRWGYF